MNIGAIPFTVEGYGQPVQWLAIAGGAALGALGGGLLAQLLTRSLTTRKLPAFAKTGARGVGGIALGLLTAMWVWQGGTWGPGGPGGPGPGQSANSNGDTTQATADVHKPPPDTSYREKSTTPSPETSLRVEVLNDEMVEKAGESQALADQRYYRLPESGDPKTLRTLKEVEDAVQQRREKKDPPLQYLVIIGPDRTAGRVALLQQWAEERGLKVGNLPW